MDVSSRKPKVFIGSASESKRIAVAIGAILDEDKLVDQTVWLDEFDSPGNKLSSTTIEVLNQAAREYDFAGFVFSPDDLKILRGREVQTTRGNVVFECGLFMGYLGRSRVAIFAPSDFKTKVESDFAGVNFLLWDAGKVSANPTGAVRAAATTFQEDILAAFGADQIALKNGHTSDACTHIGTDKNEDGLGAADIYLEAARARALPRLTSEILRLGLQVVHEAYGLGQIVEIGPGLGAQRYVTIDFGGDLGRSEVQLERLFLRQFRLL